MCCRFIIGLLVFILIFIIIAIDGLTKTFHKVLGRYADCVGFRVVAHEVILRCETLSILTSASPSFGLGLAEL